MSVVDCWPLILSMTPRIAALFRLILLLTGSDRLSSLEFATSKPGQISRSLIGTLRCFANCNLSTLIRTRIQAMEFVQSVAQGPRVPRVPVLPHNRSNGICTTPASSVYRLPRLWPVDRGTRTMQCHLWGPTRVRGYDRAVTPTWVPPLAFANRHVSRPPPSREILVSKKSANQLAQRLHCVRYR